MGPIDLCRGLCSARCSCEPTIELVISATSRLNHHGALHHPDSHSRIFSLSSRGNAFRPCETFRRSFGQKRRGTVRHISVAALRSFRRTVSLPAIDQWVLDVGYGPTKPALHEIVRLSSPGLPPRIKRCAAHLLWLRSYGRRLRPRIASQADRHRGYFKGSIWSC